MCFVTSLRPVAWASACVVCIKINMISENTSFRGISVLSLVGEGMKWIREVLLGTRWL